MIGPVLILVVHTWPEIGLDGSEQAGRMISARKSTRREKEEYEKEKTLA